MSGFDSTIHTSDELAEEARKDPKIGEALAYIQVAAELRKPPEAMQVDLEKNDEDSEDPEIRRIAADFKRERDQACAGIAERESRALQEAKLLRQRQFGETTPLPGSWEGPAPPAPRAAATPRG